MTRAIPPLRIAVVGTDTAIGKTAITTLLVQGLRAVSRPVWVHKPVACGDWDGSTADDGRRLATLVGDGQPLASICPWQFPTAASPHIAAEIAGKPLSLAMLKAGLDAVEGDHDVIVEGAGGLLAPLTSARESIADLVHGRGFFLLIVTRPDLGTLNHTALTVEVARQRGLSVLGLVLNRPQPVIDSVATMSAAHELTALCATPILADIPHGLRQREQLAVELARAVLDAISETSASR